MTLTERQALAWIDSIDLPDDVFAIDSRGRVQTSEYDLTHWKAAIGAPVSLQTILHDPTGLLAWFGGDERGGAGGGRDTWDIENSIEAWARACRALPPSPPLIEGGRLAALWRSHSPFGRGDMVASVLIGDRWSAGRFSGSQGGLVALGLRLGVAPWKTASGTIGDRIWLEAITAGARAHLELENRLRLFASRARAVLNRRRRVGRLEDLLLLAMAQPAVTSAQVAHQLKLTSAGAIKLLLTAQEEGLLVERTGQASYRRYSIPMSDAFRSGNRTERSSPSLAEPDFWSSDAEIDPASEPH